MYFCVDRLEKFNYIKAEIQRLQQMRVSPSKHNSRNMPISRKPASNFMLSVPLSINRQYSSLLSQLVRITYANNPKQSKKAYLFELLTTLRDIQKNLKKQKKIYENAANWHLQDFLMERQLGNGGNLIGKLEEMKNEIELCQERIAASNELQRQMEEEEQVDEERQLQEELEKLTKKRILLQSRQEVMEEQLEIAEKRSRQEKLLLLEEEMKLRGLESTK